MRYPPKSHLGIVIIRDRDRLEVVKIKEIVVSALKKLLYEDVRHSVATVQHGRTRIHKWS